MIKALLATNVKDEDNMEEWVDYHLRLGFDSILIWDDGSDPPVSPFSPPVIVRKSDHLRVKLEYMQETIGYAKDQGYHFLLYLDADEYLHLPERNVNRFLQKVPSGVMSIYFPWLLFGSNGLETNPQPSCIHPFTRCASKTNSLIKPFVRLSRVIGVKNPHLYLYDQEPTRENTRYAPFEVMTTFSAIQPAMTRPPSNDTYFIAHYRYQSWGQFRRRKTRARDDTRTLWKLPFDIRSQTAPSSFHKDSNHRVFTGMVDAYNQLLLK